MFCLTCNESKIYESFTFWNKLLFHHIQFRCTCMLLLLNCGFFWSLLFGVWDYTIFLLWKCFIIFSYIYLAMTYNFWILYYIFIGVFSYTHVYLLEYSLNFNLCHPVPGTFCFPPFDKTTVCVWLAVLTFIPSQDMNSLCTSLCKVSMVVFWTTVKSAVFPMIV